VWLVLGVLEVLCERCCLIVLKVCFVFPALFGVASLFRACVL
jgi:hypothetical protein